MRTLRLALVGMVALALLGGLSGVVVAQEEPEASEPGGSTTFEFTVPIDILAPTVSPTTQHSPGRTEYLGEVFESVDDTGDPRLRGRTWFIENNYEYTDSGGLVGVGNAGIDNEGGSWRGPLYGYVTPDGRANTLVLLTGDGDYDEQSAIMFILHDGTGVSYDVLGMVFPGELPPFPDLLEPPAE